MELVLVLESSLVVPYVHNKYAPQQVPVSFEDYAHYRTVSMVHHPILLQSCWGFRLFLHQIRLTRPSLHRPEIPKMTAANHPERKIKCTHCWNYTIGTFRS